MAQAVKCPSCGTVLSASDVLSNMVDPHEYGIPDDGSMIFVTPAYDDPRDPNSLDHTGLGAHNAPAAATISGIGQGLATGGGGVDYSVPGTGSSGRRPVRDDDGYLVDDVDLATARAEWDDITVLRRVRADELTHESLPDGSVRERALSRKGEKELSKLDRAWRRAELRYQWASQAEHERTAETVLPFHEDEPGASDQPRFRSCPDRRSDWRWQERER